MNLLRNLESSWNIYQLKFHLQTCSTQRLAFPSADKRFLIWDVLVQHELSERWSADSLLRHKGPKFNFILSGLHNGVTVVPSGSIRDLGLRKKKDITSGHITTGHANPEQLLQPHLRNLPNPLKALNSSTSAGLQLLCRLKLTVQRLLRILHTMQTCCIQHTMELNTTLL